MAKFDASVVMHVTFHLMPVATIVADLFARGTEQRSRRTEGKQDTAGGDGSQQAEHDINVEASGPQIHCPKEEEGGNDDEQEQSPKATFTPLINRQISDGRCQPVEPRCQPNKIGGYWITIQMRHT